MAWSQISLPGGDTASRMWHVGDRWIVSGAAADAVYVSTDLSAFVAGTLPSDTHGPVAATSDGDRLYVATSGALHRTTDGLVGAAWQQVAISDMFEGLLFGWQVDWLSAHGGRLIAIRDGYISTSDDDGDNWTIRHTLSDFWGSYYYQRVASLGSTVVAANGGNVIAISTDGGTTWTERSPGISVCRSVAIVAAGIVVSNGDYQTSRVSTDGGATWANIAGVSGGWHQVTSDGTRVFLFRNVWTAPQLYYSTDLTTWEPVDPTGSPTYYDYVDVGSARAMGYPGGYASTVPGGASAGPLSLPIELIVTPTPALTLPIELRVGAEPPALTLPVELCVLPDSVFGGLGGAGGWPAAPTGKWKPVVMLDGVILSRVVGQIQVNHADNEARTAEFSFMPEAVLQPMSLTGRRVEIGISERGAGGVSLNYQRLFSGVIDVPSVDLVTRTITAQCHDQMQEILAATDRAWIDANIGGRWREEVSGVPADNREYAEARRASVPVSLALDTNQAMRVIPWRGAGLRSVSIRKADIWDESLSINLASRDELRTRIVCRMQYRYEQLRGRGAIAQYLQPLRFFVGDKRGTKNDEQVLWLTTAMVNAAVENLSGWNVDSLVVTNPLPGSTLVGSVPTQGIYIISESTAPSLALGFTARISTRWQQSVIEDYTVEVVLPTLETMLGAPVSEEIGATLTAQFDVDDWKNDRSVEPAIAIPAVGDSVFPYHPPGFAREDADEVLRTLLDQAWVRLWSYQRTGLLSFAMPLNPSIWLDTWVDFESDSIRAAGKVVDISHTMTPETDEATTAVSIAVGLPGGADAAQPEWVLPVIDEIDYTRPPERYSVEIGTYVGGRATSPPHDENWIGFVTNIDGAEIIGRNWYDRRLSMRTPDVDAADRDPMTLTATATIETAVPTDTLELL